jgi:hypothetical protein
MKLARRQLIKLAASTAILPALPPRDCASSAQSRRFGPYSPVILRRALAHHPAHIGRPLGRYAHVRIGFRRVRCENIQVHDDRPRLALPRRQYSRRNRTGPCFLDHEPGDVRQRCGSFRYASPVVFRPAACGCKKRCRNRDGYFFYMHEVSRHVVKAGTQCRLFFRDRQPGRPLPAPRALSGELARSRLARAASVLHDPGCMAP